MHVDDCIVSSDMRDIALDVISAVALNCIYRDDLLTTLCVEADFSSTCTVIAVYAVSISLHLYLDDVVSSTRLRESIPHSNLVKIESWIPM